ncbi:hypothetical protein Bbelb_282960 [Branchiostoma belcheri]|nr:hypothetical protein Bbelb_282960 [Branchiostoma belcheri]
MSTTMQYLRDCDKEASENGTAAWVTTVANERGEVLKGVLAASEDSEIFPVEYDVYRKDRNSQGGALYGKIFPMPMAILEGMLGRAPYDKSLPLRSPQKEQETTDQDNLQSTISASKTLFLKQEDNRPEATCTVQELIVHDTEETLSEVPPTQADEWLTISLTRLTMEDRQQLLGQRLSEKHICDQHLLKEEFPLNFSSCRPVPAMAECIQMHHIGDHWAVSCTQEIKTGVTVYGSMYTTVGMSLRIQLVSLYKHHVSVDEGILPVTVIRAQRQWITICSDPWVLSTVSKGLRVHLTGRPHQLVPPEEVTGLNLEAENLMAAEVLSLKQKWVILEVPPVEGQFLSRLFLVPKKDGTWRAVVNLKPLNQYVVADHFKMEATLDIKDAYFHIPLHQST